MTNLTASGLSLAGRSALNSRMPHSFQAGLAGTTLSRKIRRSFKALGSRRPSGCQLDGHGDVIVNGSPMAVSFAIALGKAHPGVKFFAALQCSGHAFQTVAKSYVIAGNDA